MSSLIESEDLFSESVKYHIHSVHHRPFRFLSNGQQLSEYISFLELFNGTIIIGLLGYCVILVRAI